MATVLYEKEAKEYYYKKVFAETNPKNETELKEKFLQTFKDGAEYGYNKANDNKANEWNYPDKGELPKVGAWVVGFYYGKDNWHKVYFRADGRWWGDGTLCQPPYAWKEIIPPEVNQ